MSDVSGQPGPAPAEAAAAPRKKRTCLICGCAGCLAAFIVVGMLSIIFSGFIIELFRSLIVPK
jgi:predicted lipid-binding transport protein (Tim44 family)